MSSNYTFHINSLVLANSRPVTAPGPEFKAGPIKHWRKQLMPNNVNGFSKPTINSINMPNGTINVTEHCPTCADSKVNFLKTYMPNLSSNSHPQYPLPQKDDAYYDNNLKHKICRACNPEAHRIKPAVTNISKVYYNNTQSYLKSKDQLYNQNITLSTINTGVSGEFYSGKCYTNCDNNHSPTIHSTTIYKPSNTNYSKQGAVSSGLRLANLKRNAITNNANSFKKIYGFSAANAGKYNTYSDTPFLIKSKYAQPKCEIKTC